MDKIVQLYGWVCPLCLRGQSPHSVSCDCKSVNPPGTWERTYNPRKGEYEPVISSAHSFTEGHEPSLQDQVEAWNKTSEQTDRIIADMQKRIFDLEHQLAFYADKNQNQ